MRGFFGANNSTYTPPQFHFQRIQLSLGCGASIAAERCVQLRIDNEKLYYNRWIFWNW